MRNFRTFTVYILLFQTNLLASGGAESEIFIWDLNNHEKPMTPGAKSQVGYGFCAGVIMFNQLNLSLLNFVVVNKCEYSMF